MGMKKRKKRKTKSLKLKRFVLLEKLQNQQYVVLITDTAAGIVTCTIPSTLGN